TEYTDVSLKEDDMPWDYSLVENLHLGQRWLYKGIIDSHGECLPELKKVVWDFKPGIFAGQSSDYAKIVREGLICYESGYSAALLSLDSNVQVPMNSCLGGTTLTNMPSPSNRLGFKNFSQMVQAASRKDCGYWVLVEVAHFTLGYRPVDAINKVYQAAPGL